VNGTAIFLDNETAQMVAIYHSRVQPGGIGKQLQTFTRIVTKNHMERSRIRLGPHERVIHTRFISYAVNEGAHLGQFVFGVFFELFSVN
jgi:hypothetical protein